MHPASHVPDAVVTAVKLKNDLHSIVRRVALESQPVLILCFDFCIQPSSVLRYFMYSVSTNAISRREQECSNADI
jgi:hypothetical protein